ncbi:zinc finger protein 777-like [Ruditapes philippinarum]|uniref:zinc finger protein 777-like n=1 Tax=Ruditapes philippinarum TaxID=129788 RepID=UPI00295BFF01|nr:zinc finger protein 777-like [Ruditapes philippinarum]
MVSGQQQEFGMRYLVMFVCDQCGKRYKTPGGVRKHVAGHLEQPLTLVENVEGYFIAGKTMNNICCAMAKQKPLFVKHVEKSFKTKNDLDSHRRRERTGQTHECDVCGKRFTSSRDLEEHSRKHSGDFPEICSVCSKRYRHRASLRRHLKTHSN